MEDKERILDNDTELDENTLQDDEIRDIERRIETLEERIGSMRREEVLAENEMIEEDNKNAETDLLENKEAPEADEATEEETVEINDPVEESLTEEESSLVITKEMIDALNESDESATPVTEEKEDAVHAFWSDTDHLNFRTLLKSAPLCKWEAFFCLLRQKEKSLARLIC